MSSYSDYRQAWVNAGYRSNMASAIACLPPSSKNIFRVYHLTSADHALSNLKLGRLKVARFSDLNDPFELLGVNFRERKVRDVIRNFKNTYNSHTGLICFSEDWADPMLWSHYAEKHTGICLGFNVPRGSLDKVEYEDDRVQASLDRIGDTLQIDQQLQQQLLCTKYSRWKYEQEHRRLIALKDTIQDGLLHFVPFGSDLELAEVILGAQCRVSLTSVREIVQSHYSSVSVFRARLAFNFFHIVPDERSLLEHQSGPIFLSASTATHADD